MYIKKKYAAENVTLLYPCTDKIDQSKDIRFISHEEHDRIEIKIRFVDLFDIKKIIRKHNCGNKFDRQLLSTRGENIEMQEASYEDIKYYLENIPGVVVINMDGIVTYLNEQCAGYFESQEKKFWGAISLRRSRIRR